MGFALHLLIASVFPVLMLVAAVKDATAYIIPNRLSAALVLAFLPAAIAMGLAPSTIGLCVVVGVVALLAAIGMFAAGWIGGGDAKLFASAALWLGWPASVSFLVWTALAGGALASALLIARKAPRGLAAQGPAWVGRLLEPNSDVPYGVAIAVGALGAFPSSALYHALALH